METAEGHGYWDQPRCHLGNFTSAPELASLLLLLPLLVVCWRCCPSLSLRFFAPVSFKLVFWLWFSDPLPVLLPSVVTVVLKQRFSNYLIAIQCLQLFRFCRWIIFFSPSFSHSLCSCRFRGSGRAGVYSLVFRGWRCSMSVVCMFL